MVIYTAVLTLTLILSHKLWILVSCLFSKDKENYSIAHHLFISLPALWSL